MSNNNYCCPQYEKKNLSVSHNLSNSLLMIHGSATHLKICSFVFTD